MGATQDSLDHWEMVMPELNFLGLWFEPMLYRHGAQYMCGAVRLGHAGSCIRAQEVTWELTKHTMEVQKLPAVQ